MFFFVFPTTSYPLELIYQALYIPNHIPRYANQIYYHSLYIYLNILYGSNTLSTRKLSLQGHLPFQSQTTQSITTQSSVESVLNSLQNDRCSFIFHHSTYSYNHPQQYPPRNPSTTSTNFHLKMSPPNLSPKPSLQSPPTFSSSTPRLFAILTIPTKNLFPYLKHSSKLCCANSPMSK